MSWGSSVHRDAARADVAARLMEFQPAFSNPAHPAIESLRSGTLILFDPIDDDFLVLIAQDPAHLELLKRLAFTSLAFVPMKARDRALGVLVFGVTADSGRRYGEADLTLAQEVGRRAALAVENALLYRKA
jgi:GAF domain-containing protein